MAFNIPSNLTFDEFYRLNDILVVKKLFGLDPKVHRSSIRDAVRTMRSSEDDCKVSFRFSLSKHDQLDSKFALPDKVADIDLYTQHWSNKEAPSHLRDFSKQFLGCQAGYCSHPYRTLGGFSTWYHCLSGSTIVTIIEPTKRNLVKFSISKDTRCFAPDPGTITIKSLEPGEFCLVPPGYIITIESPVPTFLYCGQFLTYDFETQIECLNDDIRDQQIGSELVVEIKTLYWLTAAKLAFMKNKEMKDIDLTKVSHLKRVLTEWRHSESKSMTSIAPKNIRNLLILRDFIRRDFAKLRPTIIRPKHKPQRAIKQ